jgi:hypothetical protein
MGKHHKEFFESTTNYSFESYLKHLLAKGYDLKKRRCRKLLHDYKGNSKLALNYDLTIHQLALIGDSMKVAKVSTLFETGEAIV